MEKLDTWTVTVEFSVFAGDMEKENVISNAEDILKDMTYGSDLEHFTVTEAIRDEY